MPRQELYEIESRSHVIIITQFDISQKCVVVERVGAMKNSYCVSGTILNFELCIASPFNGSPLIKIIWHGRNPA